MKKLFFSLLAGLLCLSATAQSPQDTQPRFFLPVDAGASFCTRDGVEAAFYMRACLEYRFDLQKGFFVTGEIDTRTHPYTSGGVILGNAASGDIAYVDILLGPGWRFMLSDRFKIALALQGGVTNAAIKEVKPSNTSGKYNLDTVDKWYPAAKAGMMLEYYINPLFDLFLAAGFPAAKIPVESASTDPFVLFPTVSVGFSMAL